MGATLWRCREQLSVTVVVKTTFRLQPDGPMVVIEPQPVRTRDEPSGALLSSPRAPADTAPQLRQADVVLFGHAYAPATDGSAPTAPVTEMTVRLAVGRAGKTLLDKSLRVVGDRELHGPPTPFDRMPLLYERALGGPDFPDNPLGVGRASSVGRLPNVLVASDPGGTVAGFGSVPLFFQWRAQLLGSHSRNVLRQSPQEIPDDFDWDYFQCAPLDQRIDRLHGDEWIELDGLSPTQPRLRTWFPAARAVTRVYGHEIANAPHEIPLLPDLLHIEPDEGRCSLVWRGSFPLSRQFFAEILVIAGGVEQPGLPVVWPGSLQEAMALSVAGDARRFGEPEPDETADTTRYDPQRSDPWSDDALPTAEYGVPEDDDDAETNVYDRSVREAVRSAGPARGAAVRDETTRDLSSSQLIDAAARAATPFQRRARERGEPSSAEPGPNTAMLSDLFGVTEPGPKTAMLSDYLTSEEPDPLQYLVGQEAEGGASEDDDETAPAGERKDGDGDKKDPGAGAGSGQR